jgi:hypothetical protein
MDDGNDDGLSGGMYGAALSTRRCTRHAFAARPSRITVEAHTSIATPPMYMEI